MMVRSGSRRAPPGRVIAVLALLGLPGALGAQDALVLGGGGARGLAHGGVVVALERLGRDPDIVVGASMGAIVGALYAAGTEPEVIWRLVLEQNWPALFAPGGVVIGPDRAVRQPIGRLDLQAGAGEVVRELAAVARARGPTARGLVPDWRINRELVRFFFDAQVRSRGDFDRLPRRLRVAAADLRTGELVVLGHGDLARAVRASMAVPGVFAPVPWEGRYLLDGGVANYLPIPVARRLGADTVIAVDVLRPEPDPESWSPLSLAFRGLRLILLNTLPRDTVADILVLPAIGPGPSEATFPSDPLPLLVAGYEGTLAVVPPAGGDAAPAWREPGPAPAALRLVRVDAPDPLLAELIRRTLAPALDRPYDPGAVLAAIDRVYATGLFDAVWPEAYPADLPAADTAGADAAAPLAVRVEMPSPVTLAGAPAYDNDRGFQGWASFRARVSAWLPLEAGLATSLGGLEEWGALSFRAHSLALAPLAWTAGGHFRENDVRRFRGDDFTETTVTRAGGWLGAEWLRPRHNLLVVGMLRAEQIDDDAGPDGLAWGPLLRLGVAEPPGRVVGVPALLEGEARFGDVDYRRLRARGSLSGHIGRLRLAALGDATLVGGTVPGDVVPALGDEWLIPGLRWGEERGRARFVAGVDVAYPIPLEGHARVRVRAGAAPGRVEFPESDDWTAGAEAGLVWATPFGTLALGLARGGGNWRFQLSAGAPF